MVKTYNLQKVAGDSENIEVTVVDEEGTAVDLTGASIEYAIKTTVEAVTNELLLTTADFSITILANVFSIAVSPNDTVSLNGTYYHECEITLADGRVFTAFSGSIFISPTGV